MSCHLTTERASGNVYIRPMQFEHAGESVAGHKHNFDHTTIVFTGAVRVQATTPDGRKLDRVFQAPDSFLVKAGVEHTITALSDFTVCWCVYSHRTPQGEIVQEYTGWEESYG